MKHFVLLALLSLIPNLQANALSLANIFASNMVLQRDAQITFWGAHEPKSPILLKIDGQIWGETVTDSSGAWKLTVHARQAGGPHKISVVSSNERIDLNNVMFGDVWLASGQSNMEWKLSWGVNDWQQEVADSELPDIRFFEIPNALSLSEQSEQETSQWQIASSETSPEFSAVAWFFAKRAHRELGVPIGIVDSTWGGTAAEAWTPLEIVETLPAYSKLAKNIRTETASWQEKIEINKALESQFLSQVESQAYLKMGVHEAGYVDETWPTISLPFQAPLSGVVWLRRNIDIPGEPTSVNLNFGQISQLAKVYVNGKLVKEKTWLDLEEPMLIPPSHFKKGNNQIAVRVVNSWNNEVFVGRDNDVWVELNGERRDFSNAWKVSNTIEPALPDFERMNNLPSVLYNAMIAPIADYSFRGVIWYQGEANVERAKDYGPLFTALISSWRDKMQFKEMPFLFVQLASFLEQREEPFDSAWARLRQQQTEALKLDHTGMAVTIDIGDADDVHPRNKREVGRRLWLAAQKVAYANSSTQLSPMMQSAVRQPNKQRVLVSFEKAQQLEIKGGELIGFELADENGKFHRASAQPLNKHQVSVSSDVVKAPLFIRYAWADNSPANLFNKSGLPASPFEAELK